MFPRSKKSEAELVSPTGTVALRSYFEAVQRTDQQAGLRFVRLHKAHAFEPLVPRQNN